MRALVVAFVLVCVAGCGTPQRLIIVEAKGDSVTLTGAPAAAADRIAASANARLKAMDIDTLVRMYWVERGSESGVPVERVRILRKDAPLEFETPLADGAIVSTEESREGEPLPEGQSISGQIRLEVQVWPRKEGVSPHPDLVIPQACVVAVVNPKEVDRLREAIRGLLDDMLRREEDILAQEAKSAGYSAKVGSEGK